MKCQKVSLFIVPLDDLGAQAATAPPHRTEQVKHEPGRDHRELQRCVGRAKLRLTAMVVGSMVGAGVFSLPRRFAQETGVAGALIAWVFSSALFGLWHILPSLHLTDDKPALGSLFGDSVLRAIVADLGAVLFTAASGCLFCSLRHRSRSLLAPMALHWATNAPG